MLVGDERPTMRIGELARRTGMAEATLRAWERRYGIPVPARTNGGHRLYSEADAQRIRHIIGLVNRGWSVGPAAARVARDSTGARLADGDTGRVIPAEVLVEKFVQAIDRFDDEGASTVLDDAIGVLRADRLADGLLGPASHALLTRSADNRELARQAMASALIRARVSPLLSRLSSATRGVCVSGVLEGGCGELLLSTFALTFALDGWRMRLFGGPLPFDSLLTAAHSVGAKLFLVGSDQPGKSDINSWLAMDTAGASVAVVDGWFEGVELLAGTPGWYRVGLPAAAASAFFCSPHVLD